MNALRTFIIVVLACILSIPVSGQTRKGRAVKKTTRSTVVAKPQLVDLGLPSGTKWADRNMGAASVNSVGSYYASGEISPRTSFTQENHKYIAKDSTDNIAGTQYDAATKLYGKGWQIPTTEQWQELIDNCSRTSIRKGSSIFIKLTGPNGKSIIIPLSTKILMKGENTKIDEALMQRGFYQNGIIKEKQELMEQSKRLYPDVKAFMAPMILHAAQINKFIFFTGIYGYLPKDNKDQVIGSMAEGLISDFGSSLYFGLPIRPIYVSNKDKEIEDKEPESIEIPNN